MKKNTEMDLIKAKLKMSLNQMEQMNKMITMLTQQFTIIPQVKPDPENNSPTTESTPTKDVSKDNEENDVAM